MGDSSGVSVGLQIGDSSGLGSWKSLLVSSPVAVGSLGVELVLASESEWERVNVAGVTVYSGSFASSCPV